MYVNMFVYLSYISVFHFLLFVLFCFCENNVFTSKMPRYVISLSKIALIYTDCNLQF